MRCNVGGIDSAIRTLAAVGSLAFATTARVSSAARLAALTLAAMEAVTVVTRYCPLNDLLGIDTCRGERVASPLEALRNAGPGEYLEERRPEHYAG